MEAQVKKPASLWLKLTVIAALLVGVTVLYGFVSTGGYSYLPSISLTSNRSYTLRVTGGNGIRFCGVVSVTMSDGKVVTHNLEGVAPEVFEIMGKTISVTLRKCEENGSLRVAIATAKGPAVEGITTAQYGTVGIGVN